MLVEKEQEQEQAPSQSPMEVVDTLWICHTCRLIRDVDESCSCGMRPVAFHRGILDLEDVPEEIRKRIIAIETLDSLTDSIQVLRDMLGETCHLDAIIEHHHMTNVHLRAVDYAMELLSEHMRELEEQKKG